jgi:very-short-patch-repair endonuclease
VSARTPGAIHTSERSDKLARRLRREPTFAERELWKALRRLDGHHFRRQAPIGPYVVDFVSHRLRLIIEGDGGIHNLGEVAARDVEREHWLIGRGYRVIRLTNAQALTTAHNGAEPLLADFGADTPTPNPAPQGGGERA